MGIFARVKEFFMHLFPVQSIEKALGVKFQDMGDMPPLIEIWGDMYRGDPHWLSDKTKTLNIPAVMCSDLAKKAVSELAVSCSVENQATANELTQAFMDESILPFLRHQVEYALAMGGIVMRPWYDTQAKKVKIGWYTADRVLPLAWDGRRMTGAVLIDRKVMISENGRIIYTKLESHQYQAGSTYTITTKLFKSSSETVLGTELADFSDVQEWSGIDPVVTINNLEDPLFVYMGTPWANNKLLNNPTGCAIFKDALESIEELDRTYSSLCWEREGGEMAVFVDDSMIPATMQNGQPVYEMDKPEKRLYRKLTGEAGKQLLEPWAPELRIDPLLTKLKSDLSLVCMQCHLDPGAYLYDSDKGAVTATEVRTKNQQTYGTVYDIQMQMVQPAIEQIINSVRELQLLYKQKAFPTNLSLGLDWGDSILVDEESDRTNAQAEVSSGLRSKLSYLMEYRGMTEEQAMAELAQIKGDTPQVASLFGA
jgi:A118 family predicted phage portal protein